MKTWHSAQYAPLISALPKTRFFAMLKMTVVFSGFAIPCCHAEQRRRIRSFRRGLSERSEFRSRLICRVAQGSRRPWQGVSFTLVTFFWTSKRKYLAVGQPRLVSSSTTLPSPSKGEGIKARFFAVLRMTVQVFNVII